MTIEQIWIGSDPGYTGAVAALRGESCTVFDTTTVEFQTGSGATRQDYDVAPIRDFLAPYQTPLARVALERPIGRTDRRPGEARGTHLKEDGSEFVGNAQGMSKLFLGFGVWWAIYGVMGFHHVTTYYPGVWKRKMFTLPYAVEHGLKTNEKRDSVALAAHLFPGAVTDEGEPAFTLVKHHNRAEAVLLADYHRRTTLNLWPVKKKGARKR